MPRITWVHGWSMNAAVWSSITEQLPDYEHYCVELPGHGNTPVTTNELKYWTESVIAQQPKPSIWIGWSLGGLITLDIAEHYPEHITALVLLCASPKFTQSDDWQCGVKPLIFEQFSQALSTNPTATLERFVTLQMLGAKHAKPTIEHLKQQLEQFPAQTTALHDGLTLLRSEDKRQAFTKLTVPVQVIVGEKDTLVSPETCSALVELNPNAACHLIKDSGHVPFLSHTALVCEKIRSFITTQETS